jgi:hypothetical protein
MLLHKECFISLVEICSILIFMQFFVSAFCNTNSFIANFQKSGQWSSKEVLEFKGSFLSTVEEFTACHWEKLSYFSSGINQIWAYCEEADQSNGRLRCIQAWTEADNSTGGRDVHYEIYIDGWTATTIYIRFEISPYLHRSWNHFCWTYSSTSTTNKLYHNGRLVGTKSNFDAHGGKLPAINASRYLKDSSIILGQEPDTMRGNYDATQAFYGKLAEFNMWDYVLEDNIIRQMSQCASNLPKGNLIAWDQRKFEMNSVDV